MNAIDQGAVTQLSRRGSAALLLAGIAGFADAVGFVRLRGLFTAHQSGNSAHLGVELGRGDWTLALPFVAAVGLFVAGVLLGSVCAEAAVRRSVPRVVALLAAIEATLLGAFAAYGSTHRPPFYALVALIVVAIGVQAAAVQQVGGATIRTTYVSGVLTRMGQHAANALLPAPRGRPSFLRGIVGLGDRAGSAAHAAYLLALWCLYAGGAVLGTVLDGRLRLYAMLVPIGVLALIALEDLRRPLYDVG
ncbi:MAG TPA: YoaK family protein [Gaiellaceae bacterium]